MPPNSRQRLDGIECLRGYAAVAIVIFHTALLGNLTLVPELDFVTRHFALGVPLFFAVSGFSLTYGYMGRLGTEGQLRTYFFRRFARIAPLFYAMLVFQLLFMWLVHDYTYTKVSWLLNAAFVFNFVPSTTEGIVPASWTIGIEMAFYAVFPFLLLLCTSLPRTLLALAVSLLAANQFANDMQPVEGVIGGFAAHSVTAFFPYFVFGIAAYHVFAMVQRRQGSRVWGWAISAVAIALVLGMANGEPVQDWFANRGMLKFWRLLWGIPFGLLCIGLAIHPTRILANRVTKYLGLISYSLYLVHPNLVGKLGDWGLYRAIYSVLPPGPAFVACAFAAVVIVAGVATVTFRVIERPGMNWGRRRSTSSVVEAAPA